MTDNEVIKVLECCLDSSPSTCKNCSLFNVTNSTMVCSKIATKFALDLINRLKEKIEKLLYRNARLDVENNELQLEIKSCNAEIERLKNTLDDILDRQAILVERSEKYAKSEAYKEFAERLKEKSDSRFDYSELVFEISEEDIDNLVKEMVGDDNA